MRKITTPIAVALSLLMVNADASAGSNTYDLTPRLNEQQPFARVPASSPPLGPYFQTLISQIAQEPAAVPKPAAENTLVGLFGLMTASKSPPTQVVNASPTAAAAPQQVHVGPTPSRNGDPSFITISGGWYDKFDHEQAGELTVEWRSNKMFWIMKPFAGAMITSDSALYGFGGILTDIYFGRRIVLSPSIAVGLYEDGDGKDLGSIIEFRSGLEIGWRFDNRSRLSATIYHISNASIVDKNPGTEIISIGYSFSLH